MNAVTPSVTTRYTYQVTWSPDGEEFIATCVEFPSLSWLDSSPETALAGLHRLAIEAAGSGSSLNQYVVKKLAVTS